VNGIRSGKVIPGPLQPWLTPEDRAAEDNWYVLLDCSFPAGWPETYRLAHTQVVTFDHSYPRDIRGRVLSRLHELGLDAR
jgi:hypothetical protein